MDNTELLKTVDTVIRPDGIPTKAALAQFQRALDSGTTKHPSLSQLEDIAKSKLDPVFADFSFEPYRYDPLPTATSIRLLQIHGTDDDGLVRCTLKIVDLEDCPLYYCLSYTWGNPHAKGTLFPWFDEFAAEYGSITTWPISCNDKLLYVTQNLYDALHELPKNPHFYMKHGGPGTNKTLLHIAAESGKGYMAWIAIVSGANVDSRDERGKTPLHYAAENGHFDIVDALIRAGIDTTATDNEHHTAIFYSQQNGHEQIASCLNKLEKQSEGIKPTLGPRKDANTSYVWIDAICIDQQNTTERSHQVILMDRIYKTAQCVSVWLGKADPLTETAVQTLSQLAPCYQSLGESDIMPYEDNDPEVYSKAGVPYISPMQWNALAALYLRQWFTRLWIIQEVILNPEILVFCGRHEVVFDHLCVVTEALMRRYEVLGYPISMKFLLNPLRNRKNPSSFAPSGAPHTLIQEYASAIEHRFSALLKLKIKVLVEKVPFQNRRHYQNLSTRLTLRYLLEETWGYDCKDPRDKIYGLLGLVNSDADSIQIYPDYERPTEMLYAQMTRHMIETVGMEVLSFNNDRSICNITTLPSWVLDYSVTGHGGIHQRFFNAAGERFQQSNSSSHPSWDRLAMTGIKWDTILQVSNKNVGANTQVHFDSNWYDMVLKLDPVYSTGQQRTEVLWRTLCMDQDIHGNHPAPEMFKDQFRELICAMICAEGEKAVAEKASVKELAYTIIGALSDMRVSEFVRAVNETEDAPDPSVHGPYFDRVRPSLNALDELARTEPGCATPTSLEVEEFRKTSEWRLWDKNGLLQGRKEQVYLRNFGSKYARRRLFRTERNFLGLGSSSVEPGDEIWILPGSRVPFVLHPSDNGYYKLVSAAYVHGIMHGEAVQGDHISLEQIELE